MSPDAENLPTKPAPPAENELDHDPGTCSPPGCCSGVARRDFLKLTGWGAFSAASLSSLASPLPPLRAEGSGAAAAAPHPIPAVKGLSPEWIRGLFQRGEPTTYKGKDLATIAMPAGGIGAGQLYLRGDGTLAQWWIFSRHHFTGYGATNYRFRVPESPVDQGFAVLVRDAGRASERRLSREGFEEVEFRGEYPIASVSYSQPGYPLKVELEAFSPFIPLNAEDSALPATLFHITVENTSAKKVGAAILSWLENAVCFYSADRIQGLRSSAVGVENGRTSIFHSVVDAPADSARPARPPVLIADFEGEDYGDWKAAGEAFGERPARGTMSGQQKVSGFLGKGLVNTFLGGDQPHGTLTSPSFEISRRCLNFLAGGGDHRDTCMNLLVDGRVVRSATGKNDERLSWQSWDVAEFEGRKARLEIVDRNSGRWGHINIDHIELADERRDQFAGPVDKLEDFGSLVLALGEEGEAVINAPESVLFALASGASGKAAPAEEQYPAGEKRQSAIRTGWTDLEPGARRTYTFALAWHFPNHPGGGHYYANRFGDAREVAAYVLDNHSRLAGDTRRWRDTFYRDSTLPCWLLERLHSTAANLATGTCRWWKNGRFWAWEGVGCCSGTCTHVWNYAHTLARLFPRLERSVREMQDLGEALHPDGLVGFRGTRNGHYAADGQAGTVLKCYREHLASADDGFLKRNWPRIRKVLEYSIRRDGDEDGLIEDSQHNTFDINFQGPNTFVGSLYLAAVRAGEEMAREMGDGKFADRLHRIFETGSRSSLDRLWDGEYFVQRVDLEKHARHQYGEGCLSDQLFGQGWAHQLGLGYIYPQNIVNTTLGSVWKYNWAPDIGPYNEIHKPERWFVSAGEAGLFTCTWPKSEYLEQGVRYRSEVWTGIEYQVAGHMVWEGLMTEALAIVRAIHDRYHPLRHNPYNEVECGDHYARSLASWGVFTALAGYEYHGPRGHLGFAPRMSPENFRSAFTAAEGWGLYSQSARDGSRKGRVEVRWGRLRLRSLALQVPEDAGIRTVTVRARGQILPSTRRVDGGRLVVSFSEEIVLREGEALEVEIATTA